MRGVGDSCERARRYANGVIHLLGEIREKMPSGYSELLDAAERYSMDAIYYAGKGDCDTALSAASYAEGLIDSLKYTGVLEAEWPAREWEEERVFLAGTFDLLHPGHVELLKFASSFGKLYVVIARDNTIREEKRKEPILDEESRLRVIYSIRYVYEAILGDPVDKLKSVERVNPDIIVLGPDQPFDEEELARIVEARTGKRPRVVRFKGKVSFSRGLRSTSDIIRKICQGSYCSSIQ